MRIKFKVIMFILVLCLFSVVGQTVANNSLFIYCGAGLRKPMSETGELFTEKYGTKINFEFNGSGALENKIEMLKTGDLYIPGDVWFVEQLRKKDYIYDQEEVAYHTPVVVTPSDNSVHIESIGDLSKGRTRIILGDESIAIGRLSRKIFNKMGLSEEIDANVVAKMGTVNQVTMAVAMQQGDAGIVWRANYNDYKDKLLLIEIDTEINIIKELSIAVLEFTANKKLAVKFMEFVASPQGKSVFSKYGYKIAR